jgi:importin-9
MAAVLCAFHQVASGYDTMLNCAHTSLRAIENDDNDVVRTACIRIMRDYLTTLPSPSRIQLQGPVVGAISKFLESQKLEDMDENVDLIDVVLQTLRDVILSDPDTCLDHNALDVLLMMVKYGAARDHNSSILIGEAFESAAKAMATKGPEAYTRLCQRVLPSLMAAFDIEDPNTAQKSELTDVAADTLRILAESAKQALPDGFITAAMPRLCRLIFSDVDFYIRQAATLTIKHMLDNDKDQVFNWTDPALGKNGLEMCFLVIGHLLGPQIDDASAAEVGDLAVSIVEKADRSVVGTSMQELLQITAVRLQTAEHPGLIQSLSMVFAHLAINNAADVVEFLANFQVGGGTALETVLRKWLENSGSFVGFDAIKQSVVSIVALYRLHDPRIEAVTVNGDLIPDESTRIRTRSQAKTRPIRFTIVPAPLKMIKVLVSELMDPELLQRTQAALASPGLVLGSAGLRPSGSGRRDDSDEEWEDDDDEDGPLGHFGRSTDTATQNYLVEFFKAEGADARFQSLYAALTDPEKGRLMNAVENQGGGS